MIRGTRRTSAQTGYWMSAKAVFPIAVCFAICTACTTVDTRARPVPDDIPRVLCIQNNPDVHRPLRIPSLIRSEANAHGWKPLTLSEDEKSEECGAYLTYTAKRSWDLAMHLRLAEFWVRDLEGRQIGYARYYHSGGLGLNKYASTESKVRPVLAELFDKLQ